MSNIKIGYACLNIGVDNTDYKSVTKKNATSEKLRDLIKHNLESLKNAINYNTIENIKMFRISSDLIPFGSSPVNKVKWWEDFRSEFREIGRIIKKNNIRVSMHPGQYSVLNSPNKEIVKNTIKDLEYHCLILDLLEVSWEAKIILHIGGVYGNKQKAINEFIENYKNLSKKVKRRLIIENDDKLYNIEDVLYISKKTKAPVVYDNLHNLCNPPLKGNKDDAYWLKKVAKTWPEHEKMKTHYSQQDVNKHKGAHTKTVFLKPFIEYIENIKKIDVDIMLEVKDKNVSCIKCLNILRKEKKIEHLEKEWARYKYFILERNVETYNKIIELLKNKKEYPVLEFYGLIEKEIKKEVKNLDGIDHVWGYFKDEANTREKNYYLKKREHILNKREQKDFKAFKAFLYKLSKKYKKYYLLNSYYFEI